MVCTAMGINDDNDLLDATAEAASRPVQTPRMCVLRMRGYSRGKSSKYLAKTGSVVGSNSC